MRLGSFVLIGFCGACVATETGSPFQSQGLEVRGYSSVPEVALPAANSTDGVRIESAWTVLGDMRFVQNDACDSMGSQNVELEGPSLIDLAAAGRLFEFEISEAAYCRIRVPIERAEEIPSGAPADLLDQAIVLTGSRSDDVPFTLVSDREFEIDVRSSTEPFTLDEGTHLLLLAFDLGAWIDGVDLDSAVVEDGAIRIDEQNNSNLLDEWEDNLDDFVDLFEDSDDDGELDESEVENALASGG